MRKPREIVHDVREWTGWGAGFVFNAAKTAVRDTFDSVQAGLEDTLTPSEDPVASMVARIEAALEEKRQFNSLWDGYVARELTIAKEGIAAAFKSMHEYSELLVALRGKSELQQRKYLHSTQHRIPSRGEIARVFAMPRASIVHSADVVARGLMQRPEIPFQSTTQDVADFMVMASTIYPDDTPSSLGLPKDEQRALEYAIYDQAHVWGPLVHEPSG